MNRKTARLSFKSSRFFGVPAGSRTRNADLGGPGYIHLTTETYSILGDTSRNREIEKYPCGCKKDVISFAARRFTRENCPEKRILPPICSVLLG